MYSDDHSKKSSINLVLEVFRGLAPQLRQEWHHEFFNEQANVNFYRNRILAAVLFFLDLVFLFVDLRYRRDGLWLDTAGYRLLFYAHLVLGGGMLFFLIAFRVGRKHPAGTLLGQKVTSFLFIWFSVLVCAAISGIDQLIHGQITVYILGACAAAIVNYYTPATSLFLYASSLALFLAGAVHFQVNERVLRGHLINGPLLAVLSWLISIILFRSRIREFIGRKTIETRKADAERTNAELTAANKNLRETLLYLDESQNMIFTLALALESKDPYTRGHSERVANYAVDLARHLGLPETLQMQLWQAAILHDIGKIGIPDAILNKKGPLDAEEWSVMRSHPVRGEVICSKLNFARDILPVIRHHHERFSGNGYPDGLAGEQIPYLARIIMIADAADAIASDRSYRSGVTIEAALEILRSRAGDYFDPALVDAFIRSRESAPVQPADLSRGPAV